MSMYLDRGLVNRFILNAYLFRIMILLILLFFYLFRVYMIKLRNNKFIFIIILYANN